MNNFFEKIVENTLFRKIAILVSLLFILGAALNDGFSGWIFGLLFS